MSDARKTKAELVTELSALRRRLAELERSQVALEQRAGALQLTNDALVTQVEQQTIAMQGLNDQLTQLSRARQQSEGALREIEVRYQMLAESSIEGILIDAAFVVRYANPAAARAFGYACPAHLIGRGMASLLAPDDRQRLYDFTAAVQQHHPDPLRITLQGLRCDGTPMWIKCQISLIRWEHDAGYLVTFLDITALRQAEAALRESEARARAVLQTAVDGIVTIDEQGLIESFNPAAERIFGYAAGEVVGQRVAMLMPAPYREEHDRYLQRYLQTGEAKIIGIGREVVGQRKDGSTFPMDLAVGEAWVGKRRIFTGIVRDITARKRMMEEMQRAERLALVGQLTSGLAHEIGTPLNIIAGNAELLHMELHEHGIPTTALETIAEQTDRITGLIHQLLTFAQAKEQPMQPLALSDVLSKALRLLEPRFRRENITTLVEVPPALPPVWGVGHQIEQVLLNILVNAWHAMPNGGTVTVQAGVADRQHIWLTFRDTGVGMSALELTRAFEPFYSTKGEHGTGLGLAMCQQIIHYHQGSIRLDSTPGMGTTVTIELLRADEGKHA